MKKKSGLKLVVFGKGLTARQASKYPFKKGKSYLFLGEIENMKGHCAVADLKTGRIYTGYHIENFTEERIES